MQRDPRAFLWDIREAAEAILEFTSGKIFEDYERGTLGLRLRSRESGAFSLEWYEMGALGRDRIPVAKRHIAKGPSSHYPLRQALRDQPAWLSPLVEENRSGIGSNPQTAGAGNEDSGCDGAVCLGTGRNLPYGNRTSATIAAG